MGEREGSERERGWKGEETDRKVKKERWAGRVGSMDGWMDGRKGEGDGEKP